MKRVGIVLLFTIAAVFAVAAETAEWETIEHIDRLLSLPGPGAPVIFDDFIIFTAPSDYRRVGVAFAYENFSRIYWFRQLMIPQDPVGAPIPPKKKVPDPYKDSGMLFHMQKIPEKIKELEYR